MVIDQLKRSCTVVLREDCVSTDGVLCGSSVIPPGILAKLSATGTIPLYVLTAANASNPEEVSLHVSLAKRFGFENRVKATLQVLEDSNVVAATATHIEFFFRDQHLSRADMWRIMQRLDGTVVYQGQKVSYLGSPAAEVRAVYISGQEVSSALATQARTKPIFRSGSARYTILIQVSRELIESWVEGDLMYERVVNGFLRELFRKWDGLKVRHQVSVVLFGRSLRTAAEVGHQNADFFHVVASDIPGSEWRELLRRLKRIFNGVSLPKQVTLAAQGNMIEAIHMAAMDFANDNVDPHLNGRGTSVIAITAGAGLFETSHGMLKSTTHLLMGNSIGVDIVSLSPKPLHPVPLFGYQRDDLWEYALPHWVDISYWGDGRTGYAASWLLPEPAGPPVKVAMPIFHGESSTKAISNTSMMDSYDEATLGDASRTADVQTPAPKVMDSADPQTTDLPIMEDRQASQSNPNPKVSKIALPALISEKPRPQSPAPIKRSHQAILLPHSLMASGRKISLVPKGLAPGRGLASTTLSVEHAQHERDQSSNTPFSPDEASSGIAKQIRQSLARKPSQQSILSQPSLHSAGASKPINIQSGQQGATEDDTDPTSRIEQNILDAASESQTTRATGVSETPRAEDDLFYTAMKAAEDEGRWKTSPWLTLLNPCNPTRDNMRVAAQYRKWQHVFPRAVSPTDFKFASMCSPAALPLTTEYKPSVCELERHFTKRVRRLLVPLDVDHGHLGGSHTLMQLIKLRLTYGFQISAIQPSQPGYRQSETESTLMSLGNVHHELQCLSDAELQVVEYSLDSDQSDETNESELADREYPVRVRSAVANKAILAFPKLRASRPEPEWPKLDDQVIAHDQSYTDRDVSRMRLVLIPVEPPRPGHATPGPARGLSDEERHIDGIQKLTQLWQRNRYVTPEDRRHQASLVRSKMSPGVAPRDRDPNPLAIEYQTRDPSAVVNAYRPNLTGKLNDAEQMAPLFAESEMYHSSNFDVAKLVKQMQEPPPHGVEVRDRRWFARLHFKCFRGDEMVNWLLRVFKDLHSREEAIDIGIELMSRKVFSHVRAKHEFRDGNYFYQITSAHRTTEYPDNASMFGRGSLRSVPSTPLAELRGSPMMRPFHDDAISSDKPTPTTAPTEKRQLLLSEQMLLNVDSTKKSDQLEIISLHYDRIHNPENCYHIQLEWVNTTAMLIREATNRWTTLAESHGLRLVQVPLAEASKLHAQHPFDQPLFVRLALRPPEKIPVTPVLNGQAFGQRSADDALKYQKALLRKLDFVLDFEAAASFTAKLEVLYSYGKPDYDMIQFIHKSGLLLAQVCGDERSDFLLVPNRLAPLKPSAGGRAVEVEPVEDVVKRFLAFCHDEKALKLFYDETSKPQLPPPSPSGVNDFGLDNDVPPIQLPPRLAHRAAMRNVL